MCLEHVLCFGCVSCDYNVNIICAAAIINYEALRSTGHLTAESPKVPSEAVCLYTLKGPIRCHLEEGGN